MKPSASLADFGAGYIQALRSDNGAVIGDALRAKHTDPWHGWLIRIGATSHPAVQYKADAKARLEELANAALAVQLQREATGAAAVDDADTAAVDRVWARITAALAEGLPRPIEVRTPLGAPAYIELASVDAVHAWAAVLQLGEVSQWTDPGLLYAAALGDVDGVRITLGASQSVPRPAAALVAA